MLGGIGFTMSLFIADLSFSSIHMLNYAKMAILSASVLSAMIGITFLGIISTISPVKRLASPDDPN
jgi:NhaA family Na+:H+ antiporter